MPDMREAAAFARRALHLKELNGMADEMINGVSFERWGQGSPTLIFLHGFACERSDWAAQAAVLAKRFGVIALDLPGHGQSKPPGSPTTEAIAQTLGDLITRLDERGVILVGHSLGCRIALEMYRQRPQTIQGLILLDNGEVGHADPARTVAMFDEQLQTLGVAGLLRAGFEGMFVPGSDPGLRQRVMERVEGIDTAFAEALLRDAVRWGAYEAPGILAGVRAPILLLQSTARDENNHWRALKPGMKTPWTELVTQSADDVELCIIPEVGHFLQIEAPEAVNKEISLFVERVISGKTPNTKRAPC
jgi:pimeloyl-ACP methyl ester carboxylesterase